MTPQEELGQYLAGAVSLVEVLERGAERLATCTVECDTALRHARECEARIRAELRALGASLQGKGAVQ